MCAFVLVCISRSARVFGIRGLRAVSDGASGLGGSTSRKALGTARSEIILTGGMNGEKRSLAAARRFHAFVFVLFCLRLRKRKSTGTRSIG